MTSTSRNPRQPGRTPPVPAPRRGAGRRCLRRHQPGPAAAQCQAGRAADYKALVCIFQYGGSDGMNMVVPSDATRHGQYAGVRGALALPRGGLAGLAGSDYGLHPAMASLLPFWNQSQLAPVFNLGPLHQPLTKAQYLAAGGTGATVPASLFSHSDQQRQWESGSVRFAVAHRLGRPREQRAGDDQPDDLGRRQRAVRRRGPAFAAGAAGTGLRLRRLRPDAQDQDWAAQPPAQGCGRCALCRAAGQCHRRQPSPTSSAWPSR
jgi:uncharacterized protein (DUF1501 family)